MAEMAVAFGAADFDARHPVADIANFDDGVIIGRADEAGPARPRVIFGIAGEKQAAAPRAMIVARGFIVIVDAGKRAFGAVLAQDIILFGRKACLPFGVGECEFFHEQKMALNGAGFNPRCVSRARNFWQ